MLIPTKEWLVTSITGLLGSYEAWNSIPIDAEVMVDELVDALADLHLATTTFNLATIYTQATPTSPAFPQRSKALAVVGTAGSVGPAKAIQSNLNMRTVGGKPAKLVLLDASALNLQMDKLTPFTFTTTVNTLVTAYARDSNAWAGRDDTRPETALSWTMTENNALRARYNKG
jgi:hypothetical protein